MADKEEMAKYASSPKSEDKDEGSEPKEGEAGEMHALNLFEKFQRHGFGDGDGLVDRYKAFKELVHLCSGK